MIFGQLHHGITFEKCWGGGGYWMMTDAWARVKQHEKALEWLASAADSLLTWLYDFKQQGLGQRFGSRYCIFFDKAAKIWLIFDKVAKAKGTLQKSWQCSCEEALHGAEESDLQVIPNTSTPRSLRCWWKQFWLMRRTNEWHLKLPLFKDVQTLKDTLMLFVKAIFLSVHFGTSFPVC